jgi:hypothetical protein
MTLEELRLQGRGGTLSSGLPARIQAEIFLPHGQKLQQRFGNVYPLIHGFVLTFLAAGCIRLSW